MDPLLAAAVVLPAAGVYAASCVAEVRGLHDWLVPGALRRTTHPHVVLTFDDGPDPARTPRLLDVLGAAGARAVFFVVGRRVAAHPDLVRRMVDEGHQVANHSWSHRCLPRLSTRRIEEEVDRCQEAVCEVTGAAPTHVRPPYGLKDHRVYRVLRARGLVPALWSLNLRDYHGSAAATLARRLSRARAGDVVLAHDGDPWAPHTASAVEAWLRTCPAVGPL